jgi:ABC-type multidrug transport system fused ATPase/permease subunit
MQIDTFTTGGLLSRLEHGVNDVRSVSTDHLPSLMQSTATFIGALFSMVALSLELTVIAVCVAPLIGLISATVKRIVNTMEDNARVRLHPWSRFGARARLTHCPRTPHTCAPHALQPPRSVVPW